MSAGQELIQVGQWLRQTLGAGTALTALLGGGTAVYVDVAPQSKAEPYLILSMPTTLNEHGVDNTHSTFVVDVTVKAVTKEGSYAGAGSIMAAAHPLLHNQAGSVTGLTVIGCERVQGPIQYLEWENGIRFNHFGWTYRVFAENA